MLLWLLALPNISRWKVFDDKLQENMFHQLSVVKTFLVSPQPNMAFSQYMTEDQQIKKGSYTIIYIAVHVQRFPKQT